MIDSSLIEKSERQPTTEVVSCMLSLSLNHMLCLVELEMFVKCTNRLSLNPRNRTHVKNRYPILNVNLFMSRTFEPILLIMFVHNSSLSRSRTHHHTIIQFTSKINSMHLQPFLFHSSSHCLAS